MPGCVPDAVTRLRQFLPPRLLARRPLRYSRIVTSAFHTSFSAAITAFRSDRANRMGLRSLVIALPPHPNPLPRRPLFRKRFSSRRRGERGLFSLLVRKTRNARMSLML
jgi:hypothetical protein